MVQPVLLQNSFPDHRLSSALKPFLFLFCIFFLIPSLSFSQQQESQEIALWANGAPGFESRKNEPSQAKDWWVKNIHNPSITIFRPSKEKDKGIGVLVVPGGGHRALVYNSEGRDPALYLAELGYTVFVLKYRLAREENSPYSLGIHPQQDGLRAMRLIRSRASEWNIDPEKLGMMDFSAGGEVVSMVAFGSSENQPKAQDEVDQLNGKPDFIIMVYHGPLGIPQQVSASAPPAFLVAANNDECCSGTAVDLMLAYRKANAPVEGHFYAQGDHAFNMGKRITLNSIKTWPLRLVDWLDENIVAEPAEKK